MVRLMSVTIAPATRLATMKISSAASTFGMYAHTECTRSSSALMPSTSTAIEIAPRNTAQKDSVPNSLDGLSIPETTT